MAIFVYKAADRDGAIREGKYLTADRAGVIKYLEQSEMIPISVEEKASDSGTMASKASTVLFEHIAPVDRITIARNLAAAVKSGLDILQALDILIFDTSKSVIRNRLAGVKAGMQNGQALSDALAAQPGLFSKVVIGMVKAGEASGKLGVTLEEISNNMSRDFAMTRKIKSAFSYPVLLLTAAFGVVALLIGFVLPRLTRLFQMSDVKLPLLTRILLGISDIVTWSPLLDLVVLIALITTVVLFSRSEKGRSMIANVIFRLPLANEVMKKIALVRLTRTLSYMIASGTMITDALVLTAEAVGNPIYKKVILESTKELQVGIQFSQTFEKYPKLFPRFLVSLIAVGEKTGSLESVLKTFANFYEEEVEAALKDLTNVIEPILLIVMGIVVGSVVLSILLPIYQLVGSYS
ncbi:MAG: type II secretion system F family protein [bacterium]